MVIMHYNAAVLGRVDERFKSPPWKGGIGVTLSRVRISPLPPATFISIGQEFQNLRPSPFQIQDIDSCATPLPIGDG